MIPMHGEPSGHPSQEQDAKQKKGADVQQCVVPVQQPVLRISGDDEQLKGKQQNFKRVFFCNLGLGVDQQHSKNQLILSILKYLNIQILNISIFSHTYVCNCVQKGFLNVAEECFFFLLPINNNCKNMDTLLQLQSPKKSMQH